MSKPLCVFQSPIFTRSGYGDWAESIAKSLLRYDKFDLALIPTPWGHCSKKNLKKEINNDPELSTLLTKILRQPLNRQPELFIQCTIPNEFQAPAKFNIGMTAGIESTIAAGTWVEGMNRMNFNIVTSNHAKKSFETSDFTKTFNDGRTERVVLQKPCEVLFWGANTDVFKQTSEKNDHIDSVLSEIKSPFAFLFVGQWTADNLNADRKDIGMLIKTFLETFRDYPKESQPCLVLKTNGAAICKMDKYSCASKLKTIYDLVGESPNNPMVYIIHGEMTDVEMNALYNHEKIKAHISYTHGEGFGHPLLLASLSGKPILAPNWSGHLDFLDSKLCKLLPGDVRQIPGEAVNDWFMKESGWFNVNYAAAGEIMKNVVEHYQPFSEKAKKLAEINAIKFSTKQMDLEFHAMLDKHVPTFSMENQIVLPKLKKINLPKLNIPPTTPPQ